MRLRGKFLWVRLVRVAVWIVVVAIAGAASAEVVLALKPDKDPDLMLEERRTMEMALGDAMGEAVRAIVPLSSSVILEGLRNGTIDVAFVSATEMYRARGEGVADLLLAGEIDGKTSYASYWVTRVDAPYTSVESLRGKAVAFSSRTSTSGYLVPVVDLARRGLIRDASDLEEYFGEGNVWYGTGYASAAMRVLSGESEAAAVSYYVLDEGRHLAPEQRAGLRKLQEQGPVPTHVIAVSSRVDPKRRVAIRDALLAVEADHPRLVDRVFTSGLLEVDPDEHLAPIREALELSGLD